MTRSQLKTIDLVDKKVSRDGGDTCFKISWAWWLWISELTYSAAEENRFCKLGSPIQLRLVVTKSAAQVLFSLSSSMSFSLQPTAKQFSYLCGWQKVQRSVLKQS